MNIGIITVHDSANFGSFLQAYAMILASITMQNIMNLKKILIEILKYY